MSVSLMGTMPALRPSDRNCRSSRFTPCPPGKTESPRTADRPELAGSDRPSHRATTECTPSHPIKTLARITVPSSNPRTTVTDESPAARSVSMETTLDEKRTVPGGSSSASASSSAFLSSALTLTSSPLVVFF
uniref:Uncharacterized protein n=1 Tax=Zea mays TaxID=4577 RepID=C4J058_MAIZE|nr:unknown [Zea mays]